MRKRMLIAGSILLVAVIALLIGRQRYKNSPDYNYLTAKLDVYNKDAKIINVGLRVASLKDSEIDLIEVKYGFRNVYIGYDTNSQIISGINNYNEVMEAYLKLRNGIGWKEHYQREVDSLHNVSTIKK